MINKFGVARDSYCYVKDKKNYGLDYAFYDLESRIMNKPNNK